MDPVVNLIIRGALALLLLAAAAHKLRDRRGFHAIVLDYGLLPPGLAVRLADLLPWLELALAAGLLANFAPACFATAGLLIAYGAAMAINLARGRRELDCGCGGPPQRLSGWLVARNALLAVAALPGAMSPGSREIGLYDLATVVAAIGALALLYYAAHQLLAQAPRLRALASAHD